MAAKKTVTPRKPGLRTMADLARVNAAFAASKKKATPKRKK